MNLKVNIPGGFEEKIKKHPNVDWSSVIEGALINAMNKIELSEFIESKLDKSDFTEEDADRLGELAKENRLNNSMGFV